MSSLCWEGVWEGVLLSTAAFRARISSSIPERVMCWAQGLLSGGAQMAPGRLSACSRSEGTVPWAPRSRSLLPASSQPRQPVNPRCLGAAQGVLLSQWAGTLRGSERAQAHSPPSPGSAARLQCFAGL